MTRIASVCMIGVLMTLTYAVSGATASAGSSGACPNELRSGFAASLPDCRAYELVTNPYKGDDYVQGMEAISPDGEEILAASLGVFEDPGSHVFTGLGLPYSFSRTGSSWKGAPLVSSSSAFPSMPALGAPGSEIYSATSQRFDKSLWEIRYKASGISGAEGAAFYVRYPDGEYAEVGPRFSSSSVSQPSPGYRGASNDLSTFVFSNSVVNPGELWPGDSTREDQSLYEYSGTGNSEPILVGVKNSKKINKNGEAELITECGTELGGNSGGDKYNAVSMDGKVIYFTAENEFHKCSFPEVKGELYARIEGSTTVDISEPSVSDCEVCNTTAELEKGVFQGASEDGSKVFFMSSQELLPGAKGNNLYEYDFDAPQASAARPQGRITLVSEGSPEAEVRGVARVSETGTHVYFVASGKLTGANSEGHEPVQGGANLYLFDRESSADTKGKLSFIATLAEADSQDWGSSDFLRPVQATPDGRYLVFASAADLTTDDSSSATQLFEYDSQSSKLVRVSAGQKTEQFPTGYNNNGNSSVEADNVIIPAPQYAKWDSATASTSSLSISDDGTYVFFQTPLALVPGATNNFLTARVCPGGLPESFCEEVEKEFGIKFWQNGYAQNVYEYHSLPGDIADGNVYLISDGKDISPFKVGGAVHLLGADPSGSNVFFTTVDQLVPGDQNNQQDIYDARVGGGFEIPVAERGCMGESCKGPSIQGPALPTAGSGTQAAGDNVVIKPRTPAKAVKKTSKKKRKKKRKKGKKKVKANRRSKAKRAKANTKVADGSAGGLN
jgi:hypothetical protein